MSETNGQQIPNGWIVKTIEEVAEVNPRLSKDGIPENLPVSFVPMPAVGAGDGTIDVSRERPFSEVKRGFTPFQEGDVLFAKITPCMENGKIAVVPKLKNGYGFGSTEFHVLRPSDGMDARYLYYYVSNKSFRAEAQHHMSGAVGQKRVPTAYLKECKIPVAPLDQQKSIVAEIEKQFSRLDGAVDNLKRVKTNLKRYKAAVLKAAVEGKLTEEWRKTHPDVEPASELLKCILAERRAKWNGKGKYKEAKVPDTTDLPPLPKGWTWATVEQVSYLVQYGTSAKTSEDPSGTPVLRMGNIVDGTLQFDELKYLPKIHDEFPALLLEPGDVLFNRTNSAELVGKTAVYHGQPTPCSFASYLIRVRLLNGYLPDFLVYYINSVFGRRWISSVVSQQVGQANVNGTKLQTLAIPSPPLEEQRVIVANVEERVSVIENLSVATLTDLGRAEHLRQSILECAFSGHFITQPAEPRHSSTGRAIL